MGLDPTFQHQLIASALMGTGAFSGDGSRSSLPDAARISAIESGILATMLNWCRLEWIEASIRGPQDGNWSLANGSPKNWSKLLAFWYGFEGQHSLHEEMTRITERFNLPEHPTRMLTTPLASGQVTFLTESWPEDDAEQVWVALDVAVLLSSLMWWQLRPPAPSGSVNGERVPELPSKPVAPTTPPTKSTPPPPNALGAPPPQRRRCPPTP